MRGRTHILEDESLVELKRILPKEWVVREKPKDYGIDVEVEIFNSKGSYTGFVFWIQLKATDSKKSKGHKSVLLPIAKIEQLAHYELPVALFRYNSLNKTFYFEWISRYAYLSSSSKAKSFNIQFEEHHLWGSGSSKRIISFLDRRIRFKSGSFSFPIKGFINNISAPNKTSRILSAKIRNNIELINLIRDRDLADIEINLLENRIVLNLSGACGSSIGYNKDDNDDDDLIFKAFKQSLLLILHQTDKDEQLFKFIIENNMLDDIINHSTILNTLIPTLIASESGHHFTQEIVEHVYKYGDNTAGGLIQVIMFLASGNRISQERVESYFNQLISLASEFKNEESLARTYYNFGGYYRAINHYSDALHYYNEACKTSSKYLKRGYFYKELGGILFDLNFFRLSAKFYEKAYELEPENIFILATLGDAEFYSGNYEKAKNNFDDFLSKNVNANHDKYEFSLKFTICEALIGFFDKKIQKRNVLEFINALSTYTKEDFTEEEKLNELINIDALNPLTWSLYSILFIKNKNTEMLFISSLMEAVLMKSNSNVWAHLSILTTYKDTPSELLNDIVNTAYFYCREDFISSLQEMIEFEEYKNFKGDSFLSHIEELIKSPKEHPMELRFWNDGDDVKIIKL